MFEAEEVEIIAPGGFSGGEKELERGASSLHCVGLLSPVDELPSFAQRDSSKQ